MFKKILIATDGTEFSQRAISHGVNLAKLTGAQVLAVTVLQPLHTGTPAGIVPKNLVGIMQAEYTKIAAANLAAVETAAKAAGVKCEGLRADHDHPWEAIIRAAKDKGCDLIVMASHGRRGLSAMILGSETQAVLTHSQVPVLVVR